MSSTFDVAAVRSQFPGLEQKQVFFDNAGGSQVLGTVIDSSKRIRQYLAQTNVQLGASYGVSKKSTAGYDHGYDAAARFINADRDEVVIGSSTTQLLRNLSFAMKFQAGDEIILSKADHESNIDPWLGLAERQGLTVKWWLPNEKHNLRLEPQTLKGLLTDRTRLVACTYSSNVLGTIHDIKAIAKTVHTIPGAVLMVDAVAYAPHRQIDVREIDVDYLAFSWYKVYGPHIALLYGRRETQKSLSSLAHYFNPSTSLGDKIGLAGSTYELTQSLPTLLSYFGPDDHSRSQKWHAIATHEEKLQSILLSFLSSRKDIIKIYGEPSSDSALRVPTVSFTVEGRSSREIVEGIEKESDFGFRFGHFYSKRLVEDVLGIGADGMIRVSLVHYNSEEEVHRFIAKLNDYLR